jgi:hypothetical protein
MTRQFHMTKGGKAVGVAALLLADRDSHHRAEVEKKQKDRRANQSACGAIGRPFI